MYGSLNLSHFKRIEQGDQARTRTSERGKSNRNGWESYRYLKDNDVMKTKKGYELEDITDDST